VLSTTTWEGLPGREGGAHSLVPLKISLFLPCSLLINSIVPQNALSKFPLIKKNIPCSLEIDDHVPLLPKTLGGPHLTSDEDKKISFDC